VRIEEALNETQGNVTAAADKLGIPRSTLRYQLDRLGVALDKDSRPKPRSVAASRPLAERILAPAGAIADERKQVTVLFADLKDSLAHAAGHDPEVTQRLVDAVLERMIEAVRRHGGTVNQVRGDGIMALFGAPLALEDHAVQACYAALAIHEAVGPQGGALRRILGREVQVRAGLNSGDVALRSVGGETRLDYAAAPETTRVASEMELDARPGSSLITAATLQLAEGFVEVISTERPDVFELRAPSGARSRLAAAIARGLTHFVGRDAEITQIRAAIDRARDRRGQVVALVGEPGVGKSRLTWEVARAARGLARARDGLGLRQQGAAVCAARGLAPRLFRDCGAGRARAHPRTAYAEARGTGSDLAGTGRPAAGHPRRCRGRRRVGAT
jgi:class 3 adenylate cyclase